MWFRRGETQIGFLAQCLSGSRRTHPEIERRLFREWRGRR
jgi:hypothetical protein